MPSSTDPNPSSSSKAVPLEQARRNMRKEVLVSREREGSMSTEKKSSTSPKKSEKQIANEMLKKSAFEEFDAKMQKILDIRNERRERSRARKAKREAKQEIKLIEEAPKLSASTIDKLGTEAAPVTMPVAVKVWFSIVLTVGTSGEPATNAVAVKL